MSVLSSTNPFPVFYHAVERERQKTHPACYCCCCCWFQRYRFIVQCIYRRRLITSRHGIALAPPLLRIVYQHNALLIPPWACVTFTVGGCWVTTADKNDAGSYHFISYCYLLSTIIYLFIYFHFLSACPSLINITVKISVIDNRKIHPVIIYFIYLFIHSYIVFRSEWFGWARKDEKLVIH